MSNDKLSAIVGLKSKENQAKAIAKELDLIVEELTVSYYVEGYRNAANSMQKKGNNNE